MKQGPLAEKILRQAVKLKRPIPKELANAPRVWPWLLLYERAFKDLIGDRCSPESPIPWTARQKWAESHALDAVQTDLLHVHVVAQDVAFLGYMRQNKPSGNDAGRDGGNFRSAK